MSMRNLLWHLNSRQDLVGLDVVLALAVDLGVRELTAVAAGGVTPPGHGVPAGPGLMLLREREVREEFLSMQETLAARVTGLRLEWRSEVTADPTGYVIDQAARADLLVVSREPKGAPSLGDLDLGRLVFAAGRPVMILPAELPQSRCRKIAIGYRGTRESRLAVLAALPLLRQADQTIVIGVGRESAAGGLDDVVAHLGCHGVFAEARHLPDHEPTAATVLEAALGFGADLLVCGAYGRGRAREWLMGGVTRDLVADCPLPCLMIH